MEEEKIMETALEEEWLVFRINNDNTITGLFSTNSKQNAVLWALERKSLGGGGTYHIVQSLFVH